VTRGVARPPFLPWLLVVMYAGLRYVKTMLLPIEECAVQ
jgi:hypothetical protein